MKKRKNKRIRRKQETEKERREGNKMIANIYTGKKSRKKENKRKTGGKKRKRGRRDSK